MLLVPGPVRLGTIGLATLVTLALSSCSRKAPPEDTSPSAITADLALCGSEPLQPIEPHGVTNVPRGLARHQTEDEVSKALSQDSSNCMRSASFLFAKAPEPVDVVVKAERENQPAYRLDELFVRGVEVA